MTYEEEKTIEKYGELFGLRKGDIVIGATQFPDRKRPTLYIMRGNQLCQYASFNNRQCAIDFMETLAKLCDADMSALAKLLWGGNGR